MMTLNRALFCMTALLILTLVCAVYAALTTPWHVNLGGQFVLSHAETPEVIVERETVPGLPAEVCDRVFGDMTAAQGRIQLQVKTSELSDLHERQRVASLVGHRQ